MCKLHLKHFLCQQFFPTRKWICYSPPDSETAILSHKTQIFHLLQPWFVGIGWFVLLCCVSVCKLQSKLTHYSERVLSSFYDSVPFPSKNLQVKLKYIFTFSVVYQLKMCFVPATQISFALIHIGFLRTIPIFGDLKVWYFNQDQYWWANS